MLESQKIAELRSLLTQLDQPKQVAEAIPAAAAIAGARAAAPIVARGAAAAKNAFQNFRAGMAGQPARTPVGTFTKAGGATKAGQAVTAAGQAVKNNAGTIAATGASSAAGYMAGKAGENPQVANKASAPAYNAAKDSQAANVSVPRVANKATAATATPMAPTATKLTSQEEGEMGVLAQELSALKGKNKELDDLIAQYQKLRPGAENAAP
jgi:hypothetical protein